jgi:hypothetical protein
MLPLRWKGPLPSSCAGSAQPVGPGARGVRVGSRNAPALGSTGLLRTEGHARCPWARPPVRPSAVEPAGLHRHDERDEPGRVNAQDRQVRPRGASLGTRRCRGRPVDEPVSTSGCRAPAGWDGRIYAAGSTRARDVRTALDAPAASHHRRTSAAPVARPLGRAWLCPRGCFVLPRIGPDCRVGRFARIRGFLQWSHSVRNAVAVRVRAAHPAGSSAPSTAMASPPRPSKTTSTGL